MQKIAASLQEAGPVRDRLLAATYASSTAARASGLLNHALLAVTEAEDLERRVLKAVRDGIVRNPHPIARISEAVDAGVLDTAQGKQLTEAYQLIEEVCRVDEFDTAELTAGNGGKAKPAKKTARKAATKTSARKSARKSPGKGRSKTTESA